MKENFYSSPTTTAEKKTNKQESELTPDEQQEKEIEEIRMDVRQVVRKEDDLIGLKRKIAELEKTEQENSGVKITDRRGGGEAVDNGKNEEYINALNSIHSLENDLKNIENKKRIKDLREEISKLESESRKKDMGEGGYIDKTKPQPNYNQLIDEKVAELHVLEKTIIGGKETPKEKPEVSEEKVAEPEKTEETGKKTMEEVEKERAEKAQKDIDQLSPKKESTVETFYPTSEVKQAKVDSEKSDEEKFAEEIDKEKTAEETEKVKESGQAFEGISKEQDEKITRLGKEAEAARRAYIVKDHTMDKHASIFKKFFGIGKRAQLGEFNAEYDLAKKNYEESMKAYKDALMEVVGDREEAEMMGNWLNKGEQAELQSVRADVKVENAHWPDKLVGKYLNVVEGYRKLDWKKKLLVGGALFGVGALSGMAGGAFAVAGGAVLLGSRILSMSASSAGMKAMFEGISKKGMDKKAAAKTNEDISWSMERGEINFEEYKNRLDSKIQNVDKELQSRKQWDKWRNLMAIGAGVGTSFLFKYLGKEFSGWATEKFHFGGAGGPLKGPGEDFPSETGASGRSGLDYDQFNKTFGAESLNEQSVVPETGEFPQGTIPEAPIETPVETPVETPTETPVEAPVETPVETPAEKPVPEPWSQEVIEQQGKSFPVHEFSREEITKALHERFNMFSGTYDNLSSNKMGEFLNMRPGHMYTTGAPWEGYDYSEFSGFQKNLHEFYDGLSPEQQAEASNLSVDEFVKKHGVDYFGDGEVGPSAVENIRESVAGAGAENIQASAAGAGAEDIPEGWQGKPPIEGSPVETQPGAELPEQKAPISGPRVEENFNPDTEKEMQGTRPYNADELTKEAEKMETPPEQPKAPKNAAERYVEAMKNKGSAAGNVDKETASSGRKSFPPPSAGLRETGDFTNTPEKMDAPVDQPAPKAEKMFPYPDQTIKQGNAFLERGYTEESLRKIANAGGLDGRPGAGGRVLEVVGKDGKTYLVPNNYESKMAAHYALDIENTAGLRQKVSGGSLEKWNDMKHNSVEEARQKMSDPEKKRFDRLLRRTRFRPRETMAHWTARAAKAITNK